MSTCELIKNRARSIGHLQGNASSKAKTHVRLFRPHFQSDADKRTGQTLFTHEIDSHNNFNISDLGVFVPLPNGDELETGSMPRPDIPGNPVSDYEEVWRDLPIHEGPEGRGCGLSWILESENASLGEGQHRVQKVFLARIGGKYLALYQGQVRQRCQTPQGETVKITGDSVSARREEWVGDHWEEKYAWGRNSCDLPSMAKGFDEKLPASWYPGAKVDVGGRRYVVRAFEKTGLYGNNRRQPTTMSRSIPRRTAGI